MGSTNNIWQPVEYSAIGISSMASPKVTTFNRSHTTMTAQSVDIEDYFVPNLFSTILIIVRSNGPQCAFKITILLPTPWFGSATNVVAVIFCYLLGYFDHFYQQTCMATWCEFVNPPPLVSQGTFWELAIYI